MNRVVCIGECMIEAIAGRGNDGLDRFAGDTFNTAVYMARESSAHEVHFLTAVGQDLPSAQMVQAMRREGLRVDNILERPDRTVGRYTIHNDRRGERSFTYEREHSAARTLFDDPGSAKELLQLLDPDLVYLSGVSLAILPESAREQLLFALSTRGTVVAFDPNYRRPLWEDAAHARRWVQAFAQISRYLLTSLEDDRLLLGLDSPEQSQAYWRQAIPGEVVIKNGGHSVIVLPGSDEIRAAPIVVPVIEETQPVDTTGAGDAFNGVYLIQRLMGIDPAAAATASISLCSKVVMSSGAILPL